MCRFITLIVPTDDQAAVSAVMRRNKRVATAIDNASIRKKLIGNERQYLTTRGHCDCNTALSSPAIAGDEEDKQRQLMLRLKRKKWSQAKILRAVEDHRKTTEQPQVSAYDSIDIWNQTLRDLRDELKLPYAGLFIRYYSGDIDSEVFNASRSIVEKDKVWEEALAGIKPDEITIFLFKQYKSAVSVL